ncbi:MAG: hypothetical protein P4L83_19795 [Nevskia sp.]|nr:hypothetical protein [Nevskia sp.]
MSRNFHSYRALVADALSPKAGESGDVVVVRGLRFKPKRGAVEEANEIRRRIQTEMAEPRQN